MNPIAKRIIEDLNRLDDKYQKIASEIENIEKEQLKTLRELIDIYKPVMEWYRSHFKFTHPNFNIRTTIGPILGYDDENEILTVYNIENDCVQYVNMFDTNDVKNISLLQVIKDGHFENAVIGIKYLEKMLEVYVETAEIALMKKKEQLKKAKS